MRPYKGRCRAVGGGILCKVYSVTNFLSTNGTNSLKGLMILLFDFEKFSRTATNIYNSDCLYSLEECLSVFRCYFETYEAFTGRIHPPIKASQIFKIIQDMPFFDPKSAREYVSFMKAAGREPAPDIFPSIYPYIIQLHFKTKYRNCDYNINHFFSGRIRELRCHELDRGYE